MDAQARDDMRNTSARPTIGLVEGRPRAPTLYRINMLWTLRGNGATINARCDLRDPVCARRPLTYADRTCESAAHIDEGRSGITVNWFIDVFAEMDQHNPCDHD